MARLEPAWRGWGVRGGLGIAGAPLLAGCSRQGSPSVVAFGAYFPGWLVLALTAIVLGTLARALTVRWVAPGQVPYPLWTFAAIGVIAACLLNWLRGG